MGGEKREKMDNEKEYLKRRSLAWVVIVVGVVGVLLAIGIPALVNWRHKAEIRECYQNLWLIDHAMANTGVCLQRSNGNTVPVYPTDVVSNMPCVCDYLKGRKLPCCPAGGEYKIPVLGKNPTCSKHGDLLSKPWPFTNIAAWWNPQTISNKNSRLVLVTNNPTFGNPK
jgi:hypothetical protein